MEQELSTLSILQKIDRLRADVDAVRPLSQEQEQRIMQKFRLEWTYHSTAIEGSSLDYGETRAFLLYGVTAQGKPFKDYLDVKGHHAGIDFLLDVIRQGVELSEADIRGLHKLILVEPYTVSAQTPDGKPTQKTIQLGEYKLLPNHVRTVTGEIHYYATPEETPIKMRELIEWYRKVKSNPKVHPLVLASLFHHRFVAIHPFDDGNGRMARLLMNLTLMQTGYPPMIIRQQDRQNYYLVLSQADSGKFTPMVEYFGHALLFSLELYLKGARGESLEEAEDLDKELAIFIKELENEEISTVRWSQEVQSKLIDTVISSINDQLTVTLSKFTKMFLYFERKVIRRSGSLKYDDFPNDKRQFIGLFHPIRQGNWAFAFQFRGFRYKNNPFGVEVQLIFVTDESQYHVCFLFEESGKHQIYKEFEQYLLYKRPLNNKVEDRIISVSRFYHQILTQQEIEDLCAEVGKKLLDFIKRHIETERNIKISNKE